MAREVANLWWAMLGFATLVWLAVGALWLYAMLRRPRPVSGEQAKRINRAWVIGGGVVLPSVSIAVLLAFGLPTGRGMLPLPLAGGPPLRIQVTGHQWWWEVRYPDAGVVTANQLILPVGRPVDIEVTSADVIHSFWVPRLGGKMDMIPGRTNLIRLEAAQAGVYRGQCAEFCGTQHAFMVLHVEALEDDGFSAWLARRQQRAPIQPAPGAAGELFETRCGQCHRVAGLSDGNRAPDLTDLATRPTLGAGAIANDHDGLRRWLREHQTLKHGNAMPRHDEVPDATLDQIAQWLETLAP
ncbi:cytochrome c oxidase subunit II [Pseudomonas oligotrophica]|uniref:cytochrome c oxidase subunit II n=1 Tax=Pseudomonas oligotrophica TaxID=2912055 RepID=UPI001F000354|nr:cytochrome c oxidase subunit II [Pseudomonas oligotrophica]MCF7203429.1 cytochrome c oxidase subunit II [Pseudomonas oligotrophica]